MGLYDVVGKEWWRGFYTDSTDFNIATAMANPGGANYTLLLRDIDAIAKQLLRLQDAGVPVLWRPLHEAEGMRASLPVYKTRPLTLPQVVGSGGERRAPRRARHSGPWCMTA